MATINVNELAIDDLQWIIEYKHERCTLCGKCVAVCPYKSIEADVEKRRKVINEESSPKQK